MAYYTSLINAWNSTQQPPIGVSGVGITSTMTTDQKLAAIDGWTITGTVPSSILVSGSALANCIAWSEFTALTAQQQSNLLALCGMPGQLLGGSTNVGILTPGMFLAYFGSSSVTIANLTALAKGTVTPWWQANGYSSPFNGNDLIGAGGLT